MDKSNRKKPELDKQAGSAVSQYAKTYQKYLTKTSGGVDGLTPEDFARFRAKDGTFMALTNLLTLPIIASDWAIEADELRDPSGVQAEDVRNALQRPPEEGGMSTPFHLVIADMLRSTYEGWRGFEKVFTLSPEGKVVYRKIVSYPSSTLRIDMDDKGGFDGFTQYIDNEPVKIDRWRSLLVTNGKERDWLKGESMLVAAVSHYYEKQKFYYLGGLQAQAYAMPARVGKIVQKDAAQKQENLDDVAQKLQDSTDLNAAVVLPYGYDLAEVNASGRSSMIEFINHHDRQMALSVLAQFLMLGASSTGSFALSKDQTDLFNFVIKSIKNNLEYHINAYVIPDLTRFNYATPSFPKIKFADLTDSTMGILEETFKLIVGKRDGIITDEFAKKIVEKVAIQLGIDLDEIKETVDDTDDTNTTGAVAAEAVKSEVEEVAKQALNGAQTSSLLEIVSLIMDGKLPEESGRQTILAAFPFLSLDTINKILSPLKGFTPTADELSKKKHEKHQPRDRKVAFSAEAKWWRDMRPEEKQVNFANIDKRFTTDEDKLEERSRDIIDQIIDEAEKHTEKALKAGNRRQAMRYRVSDALKDQYHEVLVAQINDTYNFGKTTASGEIRESNIATPKETKDYLESYADSVVEKQASDIEFQVRTAVKAGSSVEFALDTVPTNLQELLELIRQLIDKWFGIAVKPGVAAIVSESLNRGRGDIFAFYSDKLKRFEFSALLDSKVCPVCEDLDGTVVNYEDYKKTIWQTPIHFFCRCIWVAIRNEQELPDLTGFDSSYGGATQPSLI